MLLAAGDRLVEVQRETEHGLAFAKKAGFGHAIDQITAQLGLIRNLCGSTSKFGSFDDGQFDELSFERHLSSNPSLALPECWYWILKLQARFFAGDYAAALEASSRAQRLLWTSWALFETAEYHFYGALAHAASWDSASPDQNQQHVEALAAHHRQLAVWSENCAENFENRAALVGAEIARIEGRDLDAMGLYEKAIRSAHANGFIHNEAIAYEVTAPFYAAQGFDTFADGYLREARYCYLRWGADGKVRQLDHLYPHLKRDEPAPGPTSTILTRVEVLDLATVISVSQAVSGEIVLDKLIDSLMRAAIEHAGADRGVLILPAGEDLQIDAEAGTSGDDVIVKPGKGAGGADIPASLVRYVMRTHEIAVVDDASAANPFFDDPYIAQGRARSALCLPLINQGKLIRVRDLANSLTPHVFTAGQLTTLKVLVSQAAVALENARLYHDLENREAEIRLLRDRLYRENLALRDEVDRTSMFEEIVGSSNALKAVLSRTAKVAPTDSTVLITGETGTGKELIARAVHKRSRRSGRPFVSVNCAALAPSLISSELFGHEKGAFTGATQRRLGRFELGDGGTIFLDEVGELLPDTQVALLRVLQEREFERVGGTNVVHVDVRVIAATNRDLEAAVANGTFREDLFYRLNVFPIEVPPLRTRTGDILMLVEYFVERYAARAGKKFRSIDKKTLDLLQSYDWPGNIRELQNVVERSVILSPRDIFSVDAQWISKGAPSPISDTVSAPPARHRSRTERERIEEALAESRGRVSGPSGAAARLRIPPSTLDHRIRVLKIDKSRFKFG